MEVEDHNIVKLTKFEAQTACTIGCERRLTNRYKEVGAKDYVKEVQFDLGGFERDIQAAAAEMAFAKAREMYWDFSVNTFKKPDVGKIQIRHTTRNSGKLIVRPDDSDEEIFVLVSGEIPEFTIRGYMRGCEAKQDQFIDNPGGGKPCWMVPQDDLRPVRPVKKPE